MKASQLTSSVGCWQLWREQRKRSTLPRRPARYFPPATLSGPKRLDQEFGAARKGEPCFVYLAFSCHVSSKFDSLVQPSLSWDIAAAQCRSWQWQYHIMYPHKTGVELKKGITCDLHFWSELHSDTGISIFRKSDFEGAISKIIHDDYLSQTRVRKVL